jgi:molybdopterin/thiamine biosynthesis adenylyltransferase
MDALPQLSDVERSRYEWQMWVADFGEVCQRKLKASSVLVSRCGGVGGLIAYQLAAAGIGKLVLAHAGKLKPSDLNRQILMRHDWIGRPRVDCAAQRLRELNPQVIVEPVPENICPGNAERLVKQVDLVADGAPLFDERFAMNREAVRQGKPLVECAVFEMEAQITSIVPGRTPCLECLCREAPAHWKRQFPVFGAVSGMAGCLGAMEVIKVLTGLGEPLFGRLLVCDLRSMSFRTLKVKRDPQCTVCGTITTTKRI